MSGTGDGDGPGLDASPPAGGTLGWAVRTAAVVAFLALAATHHLARATAPLPGDGSEPAERTAGMIGPRDPETTGSLAREARSLRLDPCARGPEHHAAGR